MELNIYYIPTNMTLPGGEIEHTYENILKAVKAEVKIPVAVKLSPFFTNFANLAKRMNDAARTGWCCSTGFISRTLTSKRWK